MLHARVRRVRSAALALAALIALMLATTEAPLASDPPDARPNATADTTHDAADGHATQERRGATVSVDEMVFETPPPPFEDPDLFPCTQCHDEDQPPNPERRVLEDMHEDIVLRHDEEHRWCLDCHSADNRDFLRLANGTLVPFEESFRLCGQCHGTQYRDWRAGVHGRRTGYWNGEKQYLLCVHCHYSHQPRFKPLKPLAPPKHPGSIR